MKIAMIPNSAAVCFRQFIKVENCIKHPPCKISPNLASQEVKFHLTGQIASIIDRNSCD